MILLMVLIELTVTFIFWKIKVTRAESASHFLALSKSAVLSRLSM